MPSRLLVIDASLNKRLATELRYRGSPARSLSQLGEHDGTPVQRLEDPDLIPVLTEMFEDVPWVLVTGDDRMPNEHGAILAEHGTTVATLQPYDDDTLAAFIADAVAVGDEDELGEMPAAEDQYQREIVHRWAHLMAEQDAGTIRRYFLTTHRTWTPPRT